MRPRTLFLALLLSFLSVVAGAVLTVATRADGLLFDPPPLARTSADTLSGQGLNWSPRANLTVRPEARWNIFAPSGTPGSLAAYDAGDRNTQFLSSSPLRMRRDLYFLGRQCKICRGA